MCKSRNIFSSMAICINPILRIRQIIIGKPLILQSLQKETSVCYPPCVLHGNLWADRDSDSLLSNPWAALATLILILWDPGSWQSLLQPNLLADADKALSKETNHSYCQCPSLAKPCGLGPTLRHFLLHNRHLLNCCNSLEWPRSMSGEGMPLSWLICQSPKSKCHQCPLNRKSNLYCWIYF